MRYNVLIIILYFTVGLLSGLWVGDDLTKKTYRKMAIKVGCAQYNSDNGQFEWIKKR